MRCARGGWCVRWRSVGACGRPHRRRRRISSPHVACRDGAPNGAYELRIAGRAPADPRGVRQRPAHGHVPVLGVDAARASPSFRTTTTPRSARSRSGIAPATPQGEPRRKLEAAYAAGVRHGLTRSWHANGRRRSEYLYERGSLDGGRRRGAKPALRWPSPRRAASRSAIVATDAEFFASLERTIAENGPRCD